MGRRPGDPLMPATAELLPQTLGILSEGSDPYMALRRAHDLGWPHPHTPRGYIHSVKLPAVRVGKQFMVRRSDLERLGTPVRPANALERSEADDPTYLDDLAALAAKVVSTWPRLSDAR
ncbi:helix-turn-helix domain-containing protein [Brevibacterium casei]|nr:hypothetical protein [Brevibacterium casei]MBY3578523.1 helix-turn-helix domain-containing protein [Brevibacterium casei]